ncbi:MAG: hypothetical protein M1274_11040 [Actinobacteria bacterium]|nr:hypothetical protein [Actinomycetota bacterium]
MKSEYTGTWRITEMEGWDTAYIDLRGPGYVTIGRRGSGFMQYGAVEADLDCRIEEIGNAQRLEFSFQGVDEGDPISGRGWMVIDGTETTGHIYIHHGDEAPFKAIRTSAAKVRSARAPKVIPLPKQALPASQGLEARIYSVEVLFKPHHPPLAQFARDLGIIPELVPEIEEDSWGTRDSLEIWSQEIDGRKLTLSIQRAHFKHKEIYVQDLERFLGDIEALPYVQQVQIEKQ